MKGLIEYKSISAEVKDVDTAKRVVTGYFSNFGNTDHDHDVILPGAYTKSVKERGPDGNNTIFFLNQHKWNQPLGKPSVLREDAKGLYFESTVTDTSYGRDALVLYEEGLVSEHSVGFVTLRSEGQKDGTRHLQEIYLYEGSAVTMGANSDTPFTGFKSRTIEESEQTVKSIVKLLRHGTLTDETFIQLEIALKQLQREAYTIGQHHAPVPAPPSLEDTAHEDTPQKSMEAIYNSLSKIIIP
jgi:uncharacterized protein